MYRMTKRAPINKGKHLWNIFIWNFLILIYFEILLRLITVRPETSVFSSGLLITLQFTLSVTFLVLCIVYLFPEKYHYFVSSLWMLFLFVLFSSQMIYHKIFRMFYYIQSVEYVQQGFGFKDVIFSTLLKNIWWILLSLVILCLFIFIGVKENKNYLNNKYNWKERGLLITCFLIGFVIFHFLALWHVKIDSRAKDVYYNMHSANLSVEKFGLLTTVRIDVERYLTNWSPRITEPSLVKDTKYDNNYYNVGGSKERRESTSPSHQDENESVKNDENKLEIPFEKLIKQTKDQELQQMHEYFSRQKPSKKNEFTGKYKDYNLVWITAEAYAPYAVDKDLTPILYKLSKEGYQFTNFYNPLWGVSTSDGEYTILQSLVPKPGVWSFSESAHNDIPFAIGNQLKKLGYETKAYHNHTFDYYDRDLSHPNIGYDYKGVGNGLSISRQWPASDLEMIEETIDEYVDEEPFHAYYMTVSGHLEYNFVGNHMAMKNQKYVEHLDLSEQAKAYLAAHIELDRALEELLTRLEKADVLDKTLIVMTGDHYPYGLDHKAIEELSGKCVDEKFGIYENEWILFTSDMKDEQVVIEEPTYTLDMLPTISNLMGVDFDSRLLMGRDVFSDQEPLVIFEDKSFISNQVKYYYPEDEVTSLIDEPVDAEHVANMKRRTEEIFYYSAKILEHDYYATLEWKEE